MNTLRHIFVASLMLATAAIHAQAGTVITSPANGAQVSSPFRLTMSADTCSSLPVSVVGYSLDNSAQTSSWSDQKIDGPVAAPQGWHTLHVKVWNYRGGVCVTDVSFNVTGGNGGASSVVPPNAVSVSDIQALGNWIQIHDGGTPGSSSGSMALVNSPAMSGNARAFSTTFSNFGGQRYSVQFGDDETPQNFLYDVWVNIKDSASGLSNLEFDLNQTMPNGQTALMGFQCDGWTGTWDYSINGGSPTNSWDTWQHSYAKCNPHTWGVNQWHHVQIYISHDYSGWVTYHSVWLDGNRQDLNFRVFSGFALGWGPALVTNFQVDGSSSGTTAATVYLDNLTVYRW
jgi:hypothetical protein